MQGNAAKWQDFEHLRANDGPLPAMTTTVPTAATRARRTPTLGTTTHVTKLPPLPPTTKPNMSGITVMVMGSYLRLRSAMREVAACAVTLRMLASASPDLEDSNSLNPSPDLKKPPKAIGSDGQIPYRYSQFTFFLLHSTESTSK